VELQHGLGVLPRRRSVARDCHNPVDFVQGSQSRLKKERRRSLNALRALCDIFQTLSFRSRLIPARAPRSEVVMLGQTKLHRFTGDQLKSQAVLTADFYGMTRHRKT
jgi:hypothetical protein